MKKSTRWKQKLEDLFIAFKLLTLAVSSDHKMNILEQEGMVNRFENIFKLACAAMKDFLEEKGIMETSSHLDVIESAFKAGYIAEEQRWIDMLNAFNDTSQQYDKETLKTLIMQIKSEFYQEIRQFVFFLNGKF